MLFARNCGTAATPSPSFIIQINDNMCAAAAWAAARPDCRADYRSSFAP